VEMGLVSTIVSDLKNIKQRHFLKSAFVLISGTALGQVIPILTAPIVTRIYSPQDYGLFGIFLLISSLIGVVTTMQIENAILIEKDDFSANNVFQLCIFLSVAASICSFLFMLFFHGTITRYFRVPELTNYLYLLPLTVVMTGLTNSLSTWCNRLLLYKAISTQRIVSAIVAPATSILIGLLMKSVAGLFVGMLIGQFVGVALLARAYYHSANYSFVSFRHMFETFKRHSAFPKFNFPSELINLFIAQFPAFILGRFYSLASVGQYNLSNRMLSMPTMFISQAVGEVFKKRASIEFHATGACINTFKRTFFTLAFLSLIPFLTIFLLGPYLFGFLFGKQWIEAGSFTRIMTVMFFLRFTVSPLTFVVYLKGKQMIGLVGTIVYAITTVIVCYIIASNTSNVYYLLIGYVSNFTWIYLVMFYINFKLAKGDGFQ